MSDSKPASSAASDPGLLISYDEGLAFVQHWLSSFMHGDLKPWTEKQQLNYSMIVNLKNGRIPRPIPRLIQKIMAVLGINLEAKRVRKGADYVVEFSIRDPKQIELFRTQASS